MIGNSGNDEVARRVEDGSRMARALVELDAHPGYALLTAITPTGRTARSWEPVKDSVPALWQDFDTYRRVVDEAEQLRGRRDETSRAALRDLLTEPSIEIARTVVEHGLTGDVEHVETITLDHLADRMERAYRRVRDLVEEVAEQHQALLDGVGPLAERLHAARALAADLSAEPAALAAVGTRLDAIERACATDPLSVPDRAPAAVLTELDRQVADVESELAELARLRDGWAARIEGLRRALAELAASGERERVANRFVAERVVGTTASPPDPLPTLVRRLDALSVSRPDWRARARDARGLRDAIAEANRRLAETQRATTERLAGRDELRGRFESYQARAARLGCAEDPELLRLDAEIRALLWARPADPDAARASVDAYQRLVRPPATPDRTGRTT